MMDISCLLAATLFFTSNILNIIFRVSKNKKQPVGTSFSDNWKQLDPTVLEQQWATRLESRDFETATGIINSLAWFSLCIPVLQVAWILSKGGKRHIGTHFLMGGLVIAGSIMEAVSRLMTIGLNNATEWMAKDFNMDNWASYGDGMGWRVLEMIHIAGFGLIIWIDAFEWLALSVILVIICGSVHAEWKDTSAETFGKKWATLGLVIGMLCWVDFVADVLRLNSWRLFSTIALAISVLNTLILLPIWILILGYQLPAAKPRYEETKMDGEGNNSVEVELALS